MDVRRESYIEKILAIENVAIYTNFHETEYFTGVAKLIFL